MIDGDRFVALEEGDNYLTVTATDTAGNTTEASVYVYADPTQPQISLSVLPQSGLGANKCLDARETVSDESGETWATLSC